MIITANDLGYATPSGYKIIGVNSYNTGNEYVYAYQITSNSSGNMRVAALHNLWGGSIEGTFLITVQYAKVT